MLNSLSTLMKSVESEEETPKVLIERLINVTLLYLYRSVIIIRIIGYLFTAGAT